MKEYLLKTEDGKWIHSSNGESFSYVEKIEIPDGAECCTHLEDNIIFWNGTKNIRLNDSDWLDTSFTANDYIKEYKSAKIIWQREPKYKEFLNANDNYNLVMLPEHAGDDERSGLIEVPKYAEFAYKSQEVIFTTRDTGSYLGELVWQRYTQPESLPFVDDDVQSVNDQYAEIEKVSQAIKVNSGSDSDHAADAMSCGLMCAVAASGGVDTTLSERQASYGCFEDVAFVTENIIGALKKCNYDSMPHTHRMAMYMIASKMARLVNGDCNHLDSWHDICGYAKLIEDLIK